MPTALATEQVASHCHELWSGWMQYLFSLGHYNSNGSWTMPSSLVDRWSRQMNTEYDDLPESEKHSDRKAAEDLIAIIHEAMLRQTVISVPARQFTSALD